ncbi:MAG: rod shape-determining protein MreD [Psychrobium sp.]
MRRGSLFTLVIIWLSLICVAFLQVLPLPPFVDEFLRPQWMLLTAMYWALALPHRFGIGSAWLAGLMLDILWGSTLGFNGLAFGLCAAFIVENCHKIRTYSVWHQALILLGVVLVYQLIFAGLSSWIDHALVPNSYYISSFITLLAWPWIFFTLRKVRRRLFLS